jgi:hypothetical protein
VYIYIEHNIDMRSSCRKFTISGSFNFFFNSIVLVNIIYSFNLNISKLNHIIYMNKYESQKSKVKNSIKSEQSAYLTKWIKIYILRLHTVVCDVKVDVYSDSI